MKQSRIDNVIKKMKENNLKQISSGERMIALYLNIDGKHKFIVNKLFPIEGNIGIDIVWYTDNDDPISVLGSIVEKNEELGVDKFWPAHFLIKLMNINIISKFVKSSDVIDELRMRKYEEEKGHGKILERD